MTMSLQTMAFFFGLLMLAVAFLGGGFEVKEVKISNATPTVRLLAGVAGVAFCRLEFLATESAACAWHHDLSRTCCRRTCSACRS
jgi:hypothetical protein